MRLPGISFAKRQARSDLISNPEFLQGGYLRDFDLSGSVVKMGGVVLTAAAKYEHWNFPLLSAAPKTDVGVSLQVSYQPLHGLKVFKNN